MELINVYLDLGLLKVWKNFKNGNVEYTYFSFVQNISIISLSSLHSSDLKMK